MYFNQDKTTQMSAYFLQKNGGKISYLKLMKLLYLSDRESMAHFDEPMTGDTWFSMKHGPVLSNTLDLLQGSERDTCSQKKWQDWLKTNDNYEVILTKHIDNTEEVLDELCEDEFSILNNIWNRHGQKNRWELVDYTHSECKEWKDPNDSALPISEKEVFLALGRSNEEADYLTSALLHLREKQDLWAQING